MLTHGLTIGTAARKAAALAAVTITALAGAASAQAYQAAGGWTASDYATGFPYQPGAGEDSAGPVGVAFDRNGNLLVSDVASAALYKFAPGGGSATTSKVRGGYGQAAGLTFDKDGRLYMARGTQHDVVELNPANGEIVRTVVTGLPCPVGLATDPISGDLFVSNVFCKGGAIMRITGFSGGPGVARPYAGTQDADGLTFAPDGTLYAAGGTKVVRIEGTNSSSPGRVSDVANVPEVDGIVYAPATPLDDEYLVVVRNDGQIDRVDFNGALTPVLTGGSRGDLVTVGPDRCIYATLQDRVIKLGPATGQCNFAVPAGNPGSQGVLGQRVASHLVDMSVKSKSPKKVKRGRRMTLTLTVANKSKANNAAHSLTVTDTIPKGTRFVKARSAKGVKCKGKKSKRTVTCTKSSLAKGKSFKVKITVLARSGRRYTNAAKVKSKDLDPAPGNNKSRSKTKVVKG
jgi:uncharacterized repeat protein (TIGR01451 family)